MSFQSTTVTTASGGIGSENTTDDLGECDGIATEDTSDSSTAEGTGDGTTTDASLGLTSNLLLITMLALLFAVMSVY